MSLFEISHAERAGWQRHVVAELARILDTHRDLPVIAWSVGAAGASLVGQVNAVAATVAVSQVFDAWRVALALGEPGRSCGAGRVHLFASTDRNRVRVALVATLWPEAEETLR